MGFLLIDTGKDDFLGRHTGAAADGILSRGTDLQAAGCLGSGSCQEGVGLHGVIDIHLFSKDLFHAADT